MIEVSLEIKPIPVPMIYQPIYKLIMLLAVLKYGSSKPHKSTFLRLHLYLWALRSDENYNVILQLKRKERETILPWSFEPGLESVVTLSIVNKYCVKEILNKELNIKLTPLGDDLLKRIESFDFVKDDLQKIKNIGIIPQNKIESANKKWKLNLLNDVQH
jgi:hypothetical protein